MEPVSLIDKLQNPQQGLTRQPVINAIHAEAEKAGVSVPDLTGSNGRSGESAHVQVSQSLKAKASDNPSCANSSGVDAHEETLTAEKKTDRQTDNKPQSQAVNPAYGENVTQSEPACGQNNTGIVDRGSIEALESVQHAILNAAMLNRGMTADERGDINMALASRWKAPEIPDDKDGSELPDSMLPKLREVLPYIDFVREKLSELENTISSSKTNNDSGSRLMALDQSIRRTAEIGVSRGLAKPDFIPAKITIDDNVSDPLDPFAGGSGDALQRAGGEQSDSPLSESEKTPSDKGITPNYGSRNSVSQEISNNSQPSDLNNAASALKPLSDAEASRILQSAREDFENKTENEPAKAPLMFNAAPSDDLSSVRLDGESAAEMLKRAQDAARAQLEAEDQPFAGSETKNSGAPAENHPTPLASQSAQNTSEIMPANRDENLTAAAEEFQEKEQEHWDPQTVTTRQIRTEVPAAPVGHSETRAAEKDSARHLKQISDPFSDDMSVSEVTLDEPASQFDASALHSETNLDIKAQSPIASPGDLKPVSGLINTEPFSHNATPEPPDLPVSEKTPEQSSGSISNNSPLTPAISSYAKEGSGSVSDLKAQEPHEETQVPEDDPYAIYATSPEEEAAAEYFAQDESESGVFDDEEQDLEQSSGVSESSHGGFTIDETQANEIQPSEIGGHDKSYAVTDGDPLQMPPAQRVELERIERIEDNQNPRELTPQDFMPLVRTTDPWLRDIESAGYKDAVYSALINSVRQIDPADKSRWTITMSKRFIYFIQDPGFSHNLETKFSFLYHSTPVHIRLVPSDVVPEGSPVDLASRALRDETMRARRHLEGMKAFHEILNIAGADINNVTVSLCGSSKPGKS